MPIDWKIKIREAYCFQGENLIELLENEIEKITKKEYSKGNCYEINKTIVGMDIFKTDILKEDSIFWSFISIFGFNNANENLAKKIIVSVEVQNYLGAIDCGMPYGRPNEYSVACINNGFGWVLLTVNSFI